MSKYTVSHSCGHDQVHQLYGKSADRDRRAGWLETALCSDCYQAQRDQARKSESEAAAEEAGRLGLPALTGSDKQIAWAESIRLPVARCLDGIEAGVIEALVEEYDELGPAVTEEAGDAAALIASEVLGEVSAKWWIDHRTTRSARLGNSRGHALVYVLDRAQERGLLPSIGALVEARKEASRAAGEARKARLAALADARVDTTTFTLVGDGPAWLLADGDLRIEGASEGCYSAVLVSDREGRVDLGRSFSAVGRADGVSWSGLLDHLPHDLRRAIGKAHEAARVAARAARLAALYESLAMAEVAGAEVSKKRTEPNLTVTLADGRTALGFVKGSGKSKVWTVTEVAGLTVDPAHPAVARLAALAAEAVARG